MLVRRIVSVSARPSTLVWASGAVLATLGWLGWSRAYATPGDDAPPSLELTGVVRDFRERTVEAGHPDFERQPDHGFGLYCGNIGSELGGDGKPVFVGEGHKVIHDWRDSAGQPICHLLYDPEQGDVAGNFGPSDTGGISSAESFHEWFRDVPGVNMSMPLSLTFVRQDDGSYVFDDELDPDYQQLNGFFPIDDQLLGNSGGQPDHNFHFTFELHAVFTYDADAPQTFRFLGDDDVWVYVDGRLVIDLGGVHGARTQWVDLHRLDLTDGETYALDFFFAERHRTQSNFRIVTTLPLESLDPPTISALFD
jgi:fibro-slime domain-containing protein